VIRPIPSQNVHDPPCRPPVTVGVVGTGHAGIGERIVKQSFGGCHNLVGIGSTEDAAPRLDPLRTLGRLTHHQHGQVERRSLLLQAAGVSDHQVNGRQVGDQGLVVKRRAQRDVRQAAEHRQDARLHRGGEVYGKDDVHVPPLGESCDRLAEPPLHLPLSLAPVHGHQHSASPVIPWFSPPPRAATAKAASITVLPVT
jgi:hypothetical protein